MNRKQTETEARRVAEGGEADRKSRRQSNQGDNRTPDKTIGQVEYADNEGGGEQQGDLQNPPLQPSDTPEGLKRERKGPLDKNLGRNEKATQVPGNQVPGNQVPGNQ